MKHVTVFAGVLVCATLLIAVRIANARGQQQPTTVPQPAFEVASLKVNKDTGPGMRGGNCRGTDSPVPPAPPAGAGQTTAGVMGAGPGPRLIGPPSIPIGRCVFTRMTLVNLISTAYQLGGRGVPGNLSIVGGPTWMNTDTFDINAKAEEPTATMDQLRQMLQNLLTERFKLKFHNEARQVPGFQLLVGKGGSKLKEADGTEQRPGALMMQVQGNPGGSGPIATLSGEKIGISGLLGMLSNSLGRPIEDKTGLTGLYTFKITFTPDIGGGAGLALGAPSTTAASDPGSSLISALQEDLGLRVESEKVTIQVMIVEGAERPTED